MDPTRYFLILTICMSDILKVWTEGLENWKCPESSGDWKDLVGEFCYYLNVTARVTWFMARTECLKRGGDLASIHSKEEYNNLQQFISNETDRFDRFFFGLNSLATDISGRNYFSWSDGSELNFKFPVSEEPDIHGTNKCGVFWTHFTRRSIGNCHDLRGYICSVKKVAPKENVCNNLSDITDIPMVRTNDLESWKCPESSGDWKDLDGEFCYYLNATASVTWYTARSECLKRGGDLVSIHSREQLNNLQQFIWNETDRSDIFFFGLNSLATDISGRSYFSWSDGSEQNLKLPVRKEPDIRGTYKCGILSSSSMRWTIGNCHDLRRYICSFRKVAPKENVYNNLCNITVAPKESVYNRLGIITGVKTSSRSTIAGAFVLAIFSVLFVGVIIYKKRSCFLKKRKNMSAVSFNKPLEDPQHTNYLATESILKEGE